MLGVSPSSAFVLSGLEVVRVSRRETAFNQLDDASAVDLVGKRLRLAIRGGRAVECMGFEMGAALTTKDAKPKDRIAALAPSR